MYFTALSYVSLVCVVTGNVAKMCSSKFLSDASIPYPQLIPKPPNRESEKPPFNTSAKRLEIAENVNIAQLSIHSLAVK